MIDKFWTLLSTEFFGDWQASIFSPGGVFFLIGLLAWVNKHGWQPIEDFIQTAATGELFGVLFLAILLLLAAKTFGIQMAQPFLRFLSGDWPSFLHKFRSRKIAFHIDRRRQIKNRWSFLAHQRETGVLINTDEYTDLDRKLSHEYPVQTAHFMPTRIGNIILASEEYSNYRYGLEINLIWPHLWLVMSDQTRQELNARRRELNNRVEMLLWSLFLFVWAMWAWWIVLVWIVAIVSVYFSLFEVINIYGQLLRAAIDIHRHDVYKALSWKIPNNLLEEKEAGLAICQFLRRGL